jgi:hypothetical protein
MRDRPLSKAAPTSFEHTGTKAVADRGYSWRQK